MTAPTNCRSRLVASTQRAECVCTRNDISVSCGPFTNFRCIWLVKALCSRFRSTLTVVLTHLPGPCAASPGDVHFQHQKRLQEPQKCYVVRNRDKSFHARRQGSYLRASQVRCLSQGYHISKAPQAEQWCRVSISTALCLCVHVSTRSLWCYAAWFALFQSYLIHVLMCRDPIQSSAF